MFWIILLIILLISFYLYKGEIEVRTLKASKLSNNKARVGIVSDWHRKGVPYQSRFLSKCLSRDHDVLIFAYNEYVKDEADWGYRKLVFTKLIKPWKVINWIKKEKLQVVFFPDRLEDMEVLQWCKKNGVATVMIINYETIKKEELLHYRTFTKLFCPIKATHHLLLKNGIRNSVYIRWGIDEGLFKPAIKRITSPIRFIHNTGYGGIEWRKNTAAAVRAFDKASRDRKEIRLVLKTQRPLREYPDVVREITKINGAIQVVEKDLKLNDLIKLYRSCHVSLLPSKWEGIGIPFLESLSLGLPVVTVDAPPMNEWVRNGYNGLCAKVATWERRKDEQLLVKGALVDINDYARCIKKISDIRLIMKMRINAIKSMRNSKNNFTRELKQLVRSLCKKSR